MTAVREKVHSLFREKQKHLLSFEFRIDTCLRFSAFHIIVSKAGKVNGELLLCGRSCMDLSFLGDGYALRLTDPRECGMFF